MDGNICHVSGKYKTLFIDPSVAREELIYFNPLHSDSMY